jgi:hypothetical protein
MSDELNADQMLRIQAMQMSVTACRKDQDEDLILLAQEIYKFLTGATK